ncbi:MAG TPA: pilin [Syntrophorhabdaceae bacterium]|jgi:type IV pilus assembly protein PilA
MFKAQRGEKGFTLIELLIVIAIIGILAAIAIPAYTGYTKKAKVGEVVHAMGALKNAISVYYSEAGSTQDASVAQGDASGGTLKTLYGVDVPTGRAGFTYTAATRVIDATFANIGSGVDTKHLTLTGQPDYKTWNWGGDVDNAYKPK